MSFLKFAGRERRKKKKKEESGNKIDFILVCPKGHTKNVIVTSGVSTVDKLWLVANVFFSLRINQSNYEIILI